MTEKEKEYLNASQKINMLDIRFEDSDFSIKVNYFRYITFNRRKQRQVNTKTHSHSFYEMHLIVRGENLYHFDNCNVTIGENHFVLIPPKVRHSFMNNSPEFSKFALCFDLSFPPGSAFKRYEAVLNGGNAIYGVCDERMMTPLNYMLSLSEQSRTAYRKIVEWNLTTVVISAIEQCMDTASVIAPEPSENVSESGDVFAELCRTQLRKHMASKNAIAELASSLFISERQLRRRTLAECGKTPKQLLDELRCQRVRELLLTQERLSDICFSVGLSDEHSLNRFFKRVEGISPGEFRSNVIKVNYPPK